MKKNIFAVCMILCCFLLQSTLFSQFARGGVCPNLLIIAVSTLGFNEGKKTGLLAGFFSGILLDISFGFFYGFHALLYMYVGYFCGFLEKYVFTKDIKMPILFIAICDFVYGILYYFFAFLLNGKFHFIFYLKNIIIPEVIFTVIMTCVLYPLFYFVIHWIERKEKGEQPIV